MPCDKNCGVGCAPYRKMIFEITIVICRHDLRRKNWINREGFRQPRCAPVCACNLVSPLNLSVDDHPSSNNFCKLVVERTRMIHTNGKSDLAESLCFEVTRHYIFPRGIMSLTMTQVCFRMNTELC